MKKSKGKKTYKTELFPYQDLTEWVLGDFKILNRFSPKDEPEVLNGTSWKCECTKCGKPRSISGPMIVKGGYKPCSCTQELPEPEDAELVGQGLIYQKENSPEAFMEYINRKREESLSNNSSEYIYQTRTKP